MSYVVPEPVGGALVCPICRCVMRAEVGRNFNGGGPWLWYRCPWDPEHVTRALPLPNVNVPGLWPRGRLPV